MDKTGRRGREGRTGHTSFKQMEFVFPRENNRKAVRVCRGSQRTRAKIDTAQTRLATHRLRLPGVSESVVFHGS